MNNNKRKFLFCGLLIFTFLITFTNLFAQSEEDLSRIYKNAKNRKGKHPIIIIPGILGSELINKDTKEMVWFKVRRAKGDDLRLPITLTPKLSKDNLEPGDILREVEISFLPDVKIYQQLIETLEKYGGYEEASWDKPPKSLDDKFFVFPYDWRRDNVETAHILLKKIDKLRKASKEPRAKFNILGHSMGGLIARYAAMYGKSDLPKGRVRPNWRGEKYFNKIFLFGTPNEGSAKALETLLKGRSSLGIRSKLPFVRNLTPIDIATMPSIFQLLPHQQSARVYDGELKPLKLDLYDVNTWKKYGWAIFDKNVTLEGFSEAEIGRFENYFAVLLKRAKKFHEAIDAQSSRRVSVGMFIVGSDCKRTLDAIIVYKKDNQWVTLTDARTFKNSKGKKIYRSQLKDLLYKQGDGEVTRSSLLAETLASNRRRSNLFDSALPVTSAFFICEEHQKITSNLAVQNNILTALVSEASK